MGGERVRRLCKNQINQVVRESETRLLKLRSAAKTARVILEETMREVQTAVESIARDEARLGESIMFSQRARNSRPSTFSVWLHGVENACQQCTREGEKSLQERLSFWRTWQVIWRRSAWQRDFQMQMEMKLRQTVEPQVEQAIQMLETDLRGLWPQLNDMLQTLFERDLREQLPRNIPDFARQRRELFNRSSSTLMERASGKRIEEKLTQLFAETSTRLRVPAGVAAAGGIGRGHHRDEQRRGG